MLPKLYGDHINRLEQLYTAALEPLNLDGVLVHSGSSAYYYADDREISFQAYGHFLHWLPVHRPDQFLLFRPGHKPVYYQVVPTDFWYEQEIQTDPLWLTAFDIVQVDSLEGVKRDLPETKLAYLGDNKSLSTALGLDEALCNPESLLRFIDYYRAYKSEYEVYQLREANRLALIGHSAAQECFLAGGSEYDVHLAYLSACKILEDEAPYTNIVGINEKSAILHYQNKRRISENNLVLLIDAGYRVRGYCSDITRTTTSATASDLFNYLLNGMKELELGLINQIEPGKSYVEIHLAALRAIAALLIDLEICRGTIDELMDKQIPQLFMPHGVGHLLGINVHDAGGHQQDVLGNELQPPAHSPMLRNTRVMEKDMVFTIEPGCYFIPLLLEPERDQSRGKMLNWTAIDELYSHGGIRIEDNVRVTEDAAENLTRQFE